MYHSYLFMLCNNVTQLSYVSMLHIVVVYLCYITMLYYYVNIPMSIVFFVFSLGTLLLSCGCALCHADTYFVSKRKELYLSPCGAKAQSLLLFYDIYSVHLPNQRDTPSDKRSVPMVYLSSLKYANPSDSGGWFSLLLRMLVITRTTRVTT